MLVPAILAAAPAQGTVQGAAAIFVSGPDGVTKPMELKATKDSEGVKPVEGFALTVDNVVSTPLNGEITVFADVGVEFTGAKLTPAANPTNTIDVPIVGGEISFAGMYSGVYTLDVIVGNNAYECIVVVGDSPQQVITNQITEINTQSTNVVKIFEKGKETPTTPPAEEPSICYFEPNDAPECKPLADGSCPNGWPHNDDGNCHPGGKCPDGFERVDDDETGTCYDSDDTFHCPNSGAIVLDEDDCAIYEPDALAANDTSSQEEPEPECEEGFVLENGKCAALDSNCGGVPCTASDKEDSTTSDPVPGTSEPELTDSEETVEEIEQQEEQDADSETEADDEQPEQQ